MNLANDAMLLLERASLRFIDANPRACQLLGYTRDEFLAVRPGLHGQIAPADLDAFSSDAILRIPAKNGTPAPIRVRHCAILPEVGWMIVADCPEPALAGAQRKMAQANAELARLSIELQTAREEERKNLATRLHGDLGQLLAALRINLTLLQQQFPETNASSQVLASMDKLVVSSITSLRRISAELRPKGLGEGELYSSLQMLRQEASARHGYRCEFRADEMALLLDELRSTAIFRLVQDALLQVYPHTQAQQLAISCERQDQQLHVTFEADGARLTEIDDHHPAAYGLAAIRERVNILKGRMRIADGADSPGCLFVSLPLGEEAEQGH